MCLCGGKVSPESWVCWYKKESLYPSDRYSTRKTWPHCTLNQAHFAGYGLEYTCVLNFSLIAQVFVVSLLLTWGPESRRRESYSSPCLPPEGRLSQKLPLLGLVRDQLFRRPRPLGVRNEVTTGLPFSSSRAQVPVWGCVGKSDCFCFCGKASIYLISPFVLNPPTL